MPLRAGVVVLHTATLHPSLLVPRHFTKHLAQTKERFCITNLGIYREGILSDGHANALVFDTKRKVIERHDPHGRNGVRGDVLDLELAQLFQTVLRRWKYEGTIASAPRIGPQLKYDNFGGMCVTFSLLFVLYRLNNPDRSAKEVNAHIDSLSPRRLGDEIMKLNKFAIELLKGFKKGSLR